MDELQLTDLMSVECVRSRGLEEEKLGIKGHYKMEHWRDGQLLQEYEFDNLIVNVGKNSLLDVYFNSGTQIASSSWYFGVINDSGFTNIQAADTMASHAGWTEFTGYTQTTRPLWGQGAASGQQVTNGSPIVINVNATGTIRGGFITTQNTKGGTTGTLFSAAQLATALPVNSGDEIRFTYTVST